jgi:hypothetical protein
MRQAFRVERLACDGARDECRRLGGDEKTGRRWMNFGSRQEAASEQQQRQQQQRGGLNGTTQAFWGCVSPWPTTQRCDDPPPNIQEVALQTSPSQHETRRRHTPREPRLALVEAAKSRPSRKILPWRLRKPANASKLEPAMVAQPVLADTPNQPSVAPCRRLAASAPADACHTG